MFNTWLINGSNLDSNIVIVLASFNGADFLREQLDSVIAQTERGWNLLIRDDGSTDNTLAIIQDYTQQDERIRLITDNPAKTYSSLGNFSILLQTALNNGAEYVFCCDQDDVWELDKLELELVHLKQLEGESLTPCLVPIYPAPWENTDTRVPPLLFKITAIDSEIPAKDSDLLHIPRPLY